MITSALILTFCTLSTCEGYVIDQNLTKQDCIERRLDEMFSKDQTFNEVYLDAVDRYQAVPMEGEIETVVYKCVKG